MSLSAPATPVPFGRALLSAWALDPEVTYLNHGTVGAPPRRVLEAQARLRAEIELQPSQFQLRELASERVGGDRPGKPRMRLAADAVAAFLGVGGDDLVFVDNVTAGINAVLRSLRFRPGDEILVAQLGYGAIANVATYVASLADATVRVVELPFPVRSAEEMVSAWTAAVGPKTRLAIVDHISSSSALLLPLAEIAAALHARGVDVLADGAHGPGAIPLDLDALGVDWYSGNLHKWAWAPRSCGILWAPAARQRGLHPPVISWGFDKGFSDEFDLQGTRDPSPFLAAPEALEYMGEFGVATVQRYNHDLAWESVGRLTSRWGTSPAAPESMVGTMATIPMPERAGATVADASALRDALLFEDRIEAQIHEYRGALWVRVSGQIYNDIGDVERLAAAVDRRIGR